MNSHGRRRSLVALLMTAVRICDGFLIANPFSHGNVRWLPLLISSLSEETSRSTRGSPWLVRPLRTGDPLGASLNNYDEGQQADQARDDAEEGSPELVRQSIPDLAAFRRQVKTNYHGYKFPSAFQSLVPPETTTSRQPTPEDLLSILEEAQKTTTNPETKYDNDTSPYSTIQEEEEKDNDALYLDADLYTRSSDLINVDGSLNLPAEILGDTTTSAAIENILASLNMSPSTSSYPNRRGPYKNDKEPTKDTPEWKEVWSAFQRAKSQPYNATQAEEMHRRVLENEQAFLQQSELFRTSLTDPTVANQAAAQRRSSGFRKRQSRAIRHLEEQMQAFEKELMQRQRPGPRKCHRCSCQLAEDDFDIRPQLWMQQQNLTTLCRTCYRDLMQAASNPQKRRPGPSLATSQPQPPTVTRFSRHSDQRRRTEIVARNRQTGGKPTPKVSYASTSSRAPADNSVASNPDSVDPWSESAEPDTGDVSIGIQKRGK